MTKAESDNRRVRRGPIIYCCCWCHNDIQLGEEYYVGEKEYTHARPCANLYQKHWGIPQISGPTV